MRAPALAPLESMGYLAAPDGIELYYRWWHPADPTCCMLAFHGLGAHGEWYETLAVALRDRGVAVLAPDARGHGLTRWDLGRLPGPALLAEDARFWMHQLRQRHPGLPILACGTSLGGCLATVLAAPVAGATPKLDGLVLLSPAFRPVYLGWGEKARMSLALLFGRETGALTPLGRGLAITGDRLRLQWLRSDPLAQPHMPALAHWHARALIRRARSSLAKVRVPTLCVQGARDPVIDPATNHALFARREGTRYVVWDEAYHDLALEANAAFLADLVLTWVRERV